MLLRYFVVCTASQACLCLTSKAHQSPPDCCVFCCATVGATFSIQFRMYWKSGLKYSGPGYTYNLCSIPLTSRSRQEHNCNSRLPASHLPPLHVLVLFLQLQTEFKRFSTVDKNWRATLLAAKAQPHVCTMTLLYITPAAPSPHYCLFPVNPAAADAASFSVLYSTVVLVFAPGDALLCQREAARKVPRVYESAGAHSEGTYRVPRNQTARLLSVLLPVG